MLSFGVRRLASRGRAPKMQRVARSAGLLIQENGPLLGGEVARQTGAGLVDESFHGTEQPDIDRGALGGREQVPVRAEVDIGNVGSVGAQRHQLTPGQKVGPGPIGENRLYQTSGLHP